VPPAPRDSGRYAGRGKISGGNLVPEKRAPQVDRSAQIGAHAQAAAVPRLREQVADRRDPERAVKIFLGPAKTTAR
jgi:hypothetical protein